MGTIDQGRRASYWLSEAVKALLPGAAALSVFGFLGASMYFSHPGVLSCTSAANSRYDGLTIVAGARIPAGCSKSVDVPVFGWASSWDQAAVLYGWCTAVIVFVVAFASLAASQRLKTSHA